MNKEEQRIAIAKACGWTSIETFSDCTAIIGMSPPNLRGIHQNEDDLPHPIPDYLNSLDAMHSVESNVMLPDIDLRNKYARRLRMEDMPNTDFFYISASAEQRASAFLKTLGLWVE